MQSKGYARLLTIFSESLNLQMDVYKMKKALLFTVSSLAAFAVTVNPLNLRPIIVGNTWDTDSATLARCASIGAANCELRSLNAVNAPSINVDIDQQTAGMWRLSGFNPSTTVRLLIEVTAAADVQRLGIWSDADMDASTAGDRTLIDIFTGAATTNSVATLSFNSLTGALTIAGVDGVNTVTDAIGINAGAFGFYLQTNVGGQDFTFYSVDQLNPGGSAQALSFRVNDRWFMGFEDIVRTGGDRDHNDLIFTLADIEAVPEPGFYALVGLGMAGLFWAHRRRARS